MEYIPGLKKSLIVTFGICFLLTLFIIISYNNNFFENKFIVRVNDLDINARYLSEFSEVLLVKNVSEGRLRSYNHSYELLNKINLTDQYTLTLKEYEAYDMFGHRDSYSEFNKIARLEPVKNSKVKLKIERMDEVLYDGPFIEDISPYITEEGRYYFHIYNKSKRPSSPVARVNTTLTFNILVVGYEG